MKLRSQTSGGSPRQAKEIRRRIAWRTQGARRLRPMFRRQSAANAAKDACCREGPRGVNFGINYEKYGGQGHKDAACPGECIVHGGARGFAQCDACGNEHGKAIEQAGSRWTKRPSVALGVRAEEVRLHPHAYGSESKKRCEKWLHCCEGALHFRDVVGHRFSFGRLRRTSNDCTTFPRDAKLTRLV